MSLCIKLLKMPTWWANLFPRNKIIKLSANRVTVEIESPVFHPVIFYFSCALIYQFYYRGTTGATFTGKQI